MSIYDFQWSAFRTHDAQRMDQAVRWAIAAARQSPCAKDQRGATAWHSDSTLMVADHNAPPEPFVCDRSAACAVACGKLAAHAEERVIHKYAAQSGHGAAGINVLHIRTVEGQPVPSGPPSCITCSRTMLLVGVAEIWLWHGGDGWSSWRCYGAAEFHEMSLRHEKHNLPVIRARPRT